MKYCIQCTDLTTQKVGDFIHYGDFRAVSPVFNDCSSLFSWMRNNGWVPNHVTFECNRSSVYDMETIV